MRQFQITIFILGTAALIASAVLEAAFFDTKGMGETLYKAGFATLLVDVVCILLWPSAKRS